MAASYLIKDTTREEREAIVRECIDASGSCDGCAAGLGEKMYQPYIDGEMEIAECNRRYRASFISGEEGPSAQSGMSCVMGY